MKISIAVLLTIFAVVSAFGQQASGANALQPQYRVIDKFESHDEFAIQTLLRLGVESKTPLGLIQNDGELCKSQVQISVERESVASIADRLTSQIDYTWAIDSGVLLIQPRHPSVATLQLLNTVIPRFAAPKTTLEGLGMFLIIDVRAVFRPEMGSAGSLSRSPNAVLAGPFEMHNVTVKQALNEIVKAGIGGQWVLHSIPEDYRSAADSKFVDIIDYGANPISTIQKVSCAP